MPKARTSMGVAQPESGVMQMSLDQILDEHQGELINLPINPDDIGGTLLETLSNGLYTNPMDCIREYVQNSVDAGATSVTIHITGNSVNIVDDGHGMNLREMLEARQFGLSPKSIEQHVGFRGIGIYSGYDICRRMRITSKRAGEPDQHVLVFEFAAMRAMLEASKEHGGDTAQHALDGRAHGAVSESEYHGVSLIELLSNHTYIKRESVPDSTDQQFTHVLLQEISEAHIKQLSNLAELRNYLLQNVPIDFADFEYKKVINDSLHRHVPGYSAVSIRLLSDGIGEELVQRRLPTTLQPPTFGYLTSPDGKQIAYYWACLNRKRDRLEPATREGKGTSSVEAPTCEGFVYKMKGFTIGGRDKLLALWGPKQTLYRWYTGEFFVLDSSIKPNAERDDFVTSQAQRALWRAVQKELERLYSVVEDFQEQGVADERVRKYAVDVAEFERLIEANTLENEFEAYARLSNMLTDLKRQKPKASAEEQRIAEELKKRIERLQRALDKNVDPRTTETSRRKRAAKSERSNSQRAEAETIQLPGFSGADPLPQEPVLRLGDLLVAAGWDLNGRLLELVTILQGSFEDILALGSPTYRNLLSDVESRLTSSVMDD